MLYRKLFASKSNWFVMICLSVYLMMSTGCVKEKHPGRVLLTVYDQSGYYVKGASVRFFVNSQFVKQGAVDETLITDDIGHVEFVRNDECYLDIYATYYDKLTLRTGSASVHVQEGETVTLSLYTK